VTGNVNGAGGTRAFGAGTGREAVSENGIGFEWQKSSCGNLTGESACLAANLRRSERARVNCRSKPMAPWRERIRFYAGNSYYDQLTAREYRWSGLGR